MTKSEVKRASKEEVRIERAARKIVRVYFDRDEAVVDLFVRFALRERRRAFGEGLRVGERRPAGMINRKMACPNCGPKFKARYAKFKNEILSLSTWKKGAK